MMRCDDSATFDTSSFVASPPRSLLAFGCRSPRVVCSKPAAGARVVSYCLWLENCEGGSAKNYVVRVRRSVAHIHGFERLGLCKSFQAAAS